MSTETAGRDVATESAGHDESGETSATGERVLGVNVESTPLVVLAVLISVALAAATWRNDRKVVLVVAAVFAAVFAAIVCVGAPSIVTIVQGWAATAA